MVALLDEMGERLRQAGACATEAMAAAHPEAAELTSDECAGALRDLQARHILERASRRLRVVVNQQNAHRIFGVTARELADLLDGFHVGESTAEEAMAALGIERVLPPATAVHWGDLRGGLQLGVYPGHSPLERYSSP